MRSRLPQSWCVPSPSSGESPAELVYPTRLCPKILLTRNPPKIRKQLKRNIFEQGFANCILAKDGTEANPGETIGMALVSVPLEPRSRRLSRLTVGILCVLTVLFQLFDMAGQTRALRTSFSVHRYCISLRIQGLTYPLVGRTSNIAGRPLCNS